VLAFGVFRVVTRGTCGKFRLLGAANRGAIHARRFGRGFLGPRSCLRFASRRRRGPAGPDVEGREDVRRFELLRQLRSAHRGRRGIVDRRGIERLFDRLARAVAGTAEGIDTDVGQRAHRALTRPHRVVEPGSGAFT
jgi:hypothetical protein